MRGVWGKEEEVGEVVDVGAGGVCGGLDYVCAGSGVREGGVGEVRVLV